MAMENALKLRGTVSRDRKKNGGKAGPNGPNGEAGPKGKSKRESGREERKRKKGEKAKKKPKTKKKRGEETLVLDGGLSPSPPPLRLADPN